MADIVCVLDAKATLGEGTFWDPRDEVLWWVNIWGREIHRFDPATGRDDLWATPEDVGCLAVRERGGLVISRRSGFFFFDPQTGALPDRRSKLVASRLRPLPPPVPSATRPEGAGGLVFPPRQDANRSPQGR